MKLRTLTDELDRALFAPPDPKSRRRFLFYFLLAALFGAGFYLWSGFFNQGLLHFNNADWNEKRRSLDLMGQALAQRMIPYHSTGQLSIWHSTRRYLAMPHIILSPQVALLQWMDIGPFLLFNIRLFYAIGFFGCCLFVRRYRLSIASTAAMFLLFNFNGYVVSHLGIGHTEWFAYFLLPYVVYYTFRLLEEKPIVIPSMAISMALFLMMLQGGFHFAIWCLMFLGFMWIFHPTKRIALALAMICAMTMLLSAVRVGPAMMTFGADQLEYVGGYVSLEMLLGAFTSIRDITFPAVQPLFSPLQVNWWEYDIYTTGFGLFFMLYFGLYRRLHSDRFLSPIRYRELDWPILVLFLLTLGDLYFALFYEPRFPVIGNAERAPSRFIIMPVIFLIPLACIWYQKFLNSRAGNIDVRIRLGSCLSLIAATYLLMTHLRLWSIARIDQSGIMPAPSFPGTYNPTIRENDIGYIHVVNISAIVTAISFAFWVYLMIRLLHEQRRDRLAGAQAAQ